MEVICLYCSPQYKQQLGDAQPQAQAGIAPERNITGFSVGELAVHGQLMTGLAIVSCSRMQLRDTVFNLGDRSVEASSVVGVDHEGTFNQAVHTPKAR